MRSRDTALLPYLAVPLSLRTLYRCELILMSRTMRWVSTFVATISFSFSFPFTFWFSFSLRRSPAWFSFSISVSFTLSVAIVIIPTQVTSANYLTLAMHLLLFSFIYNIYLHLSLRYFSNFTLPRFPSRLTLFSVHIVFNFIFFVYPFTTRISLIIYWEPQTSQKRQVYCKKQLRNFCIEFQFFWQLSKYFLTENVIVTKKSPAMNSVRSNLLIPNF